MMYWKAIESGLRKLTVHLREGLPRQYHFVLHECEG